MNIQCKYYSGETDIFECLCLDIKIEDENEYDGRCEHPNNTKCKYFVPGILTLDAKKTCEDCKLKENCEVYGILVKMFMEQLKYHSITFANICGLFQKRK